MLVLQCYPTDSKHLYCTELATIYEMKGQKYPNLYESSHDFDWYNAFFFSHLMTFQLNVIQNQTYH